MILNKSYFNAYLSNCKPALDKIDVIISTVTTYLIFRFTFCTIIFKSGILILNREEENNNTEFLFYVSVLLGKDQLGILSGLLSKKMHQKRKIYYKSNIETYIYVSLNAEYE